MTVIRQRLGVEVYETVFELILQVLRKKGLLKGKRIAIDSSVIEANAALSSLRNRFTKEQYGEYVKRLAGEAGVDTPDKRAVKQFVRKRPGRKTSNKEWQNPHDPDAKVGPDKKKVTRLIYKPEHAVDLDSGAIVDVDIIFGDEHDKTDLASKVIEIEGRLNDALGEHADLAQIEMVVADMGYHDLEEMRKLQEQGIRTAISDPTRNRNVATLSDRQRRALRAARRTLKSKSARRYMRRRGELCERSFAHLLDCGGARRATLRGRENILKRYLVQAACVNLALFMRAAGGIGTLKQTWAASSASLFALFCKIRGLLTALLFFKQPNCPVYQSSSPAIAQILARWRPRSCTA
jgi:transposase